MAEKNTKRYLLRPLERRRKLIANQTAILKALEQLDNRAFGAEVLPKAAKSAKAARKGIGKGAYKDPSVIRKQVELTKALYLSRRISRAEYVCYGSFPVETINEERWIDGQFQSELGKLQLQIDKLDKESGLLPGQFWPRGQAPEKFKDRYALLEKQYSDVIEGRFTAALKEFGLDDLADLRETDVEEFDRLRERGRRSIFHKGDHVQILKDVVVRHEEEAFRAISAKAYTAAIILIGAALEGALLVRCLRSKKKAVSTAASLPKRQRPFALDDPTRWAFDHLISVCLAAGWLPRVSTEYAQYAPHKLADLLREMRNLIHPGRCVRETPWSETDERDYKDAEAIYITLRTKLLG
jgi:hypothetical protein